MINHARTLLMNVDGQVPGFIDLPGEEFLPSEYNQLDLPTFLANIRIFIFGSDPDRLMLNYRVRQLLALLHATELVEFLTDLDSRITYDIGASDLLFEGVFRPTVRIIEGTDELFLIDDLGAPDGLGRTAHRWKIRTLTSSTVEVTRQTKPIQDSIQEYTITSGLSSLIELVGSNLKARFQEGIGNEWIVEGNARPDAELGSIVSSIKTSGVQNLLQLFNVGNVKGDTEPFKTFRNLWEDHKELAYQFGGLLLALIYQTEDVRILNA